MTLSLISFSFFIGNPGTLGAPAERKLIAAFLGSLTGKEFEINRTAAASN